jgi:chromosome segregation ATPase
MQEYSTQPNKGRDDRKKRAPDGKETAMKAQQLVNVMNTSIRELTEKMEGHKMNLVRKDSQLSDLDSQIVEINAKEANLKKGLEMAEASARQQRDTLLQKRDRIIFMRQKIAELEEELLQDEVDMESIERSILLYQENASRTESKLGSHRDEQGNLGAIREALEEERTTIARDVTNCESEIKSLEAIQNLALGDEL